MSKSEPRGKSLKQNQQHYLRMTRRKAQRNDVIKAQKALQKEGRASNDIKKFVEDQVDGQLIVNKDPKYAGWLDMFKGEYTNDAAQVDLGKVQMMYFAIIILVVQPRYCLYLLHQMNFINFLI